MNPYGVKTNNDNIRGPLVALEILYDHMPKTTGCEKCKEINGDDQQWCCKTLNPSMFYSEFLLVWENVQNHWGKRKKSNLIVKAIKNYLSFDYAKGCIFFDQSKCACYNHRPFSCRLYGIIPKETWDKRIEMLEKRGGEEFSKEWRPQCPLVKTENDKEVTTEEETRWFCQTMVSETRIGMPKTFMDAHDFPGGCYRTFHDHLLLELLSAQAMNSLTTVKMSKPSQEDIDSFAEMLVSELEKKEVI